MREQPIETIEYRGFNINIYQDEMAEDPRDWENIGRMICFHGRYNLGDKHDYNSGDYSGWDEFEKQLRKDHKKNKAIAIMLPLYLYDHSGLHMKVGSFHGLLPQGHAEWDSGMVGFIFCTWDDVKREYGLGKDAVEKAEKYLRGEVETYSQYLEGSVYGYMIEPKDGNRVECDDGCWGFYGYDWDKNGLEDMAKGSIDAAIKAYRESARKMHVEKLETNKFLRECWVD